MVDAAGGYPQILEVDVLKKYITQVRIFPLHGEDEKPTKHGKSMQAGK